MWEEDRHFAFLQGASYWDWESGDLTWLPLASPYQQDGRLWVTSEAHLPSRKMFDDVGTMLLALAGPLPVGFLQRRESVP